MTINFVGCEKETFQNKSMQTTGLPSCLQDLYDDLPHNSWDKIQVIGDGILLFHSQSHFDDVYNKLSENLIAWDSLFVNFVGSSSEDVLMQYEDSLNFNEYQPLYEFENLYNMSGNTLRFLQESAYANWIQGGMIGTPPTDKIMIDEVEQTLYNRHREVCIGDTIVQYRDSGDVVLIPIHRLAEITKIRTQNISELLIDSTIVIIKGSNASNCHASLPINKQKYINIIPNQKRSSWEFSSSLRYNFIFGYKIKNVSKLVHYTWKSNKWKKTRRHGNITSLASFHYTTTSEHTTPTNPVTLINHYKNPTLLGDPLKQNVFRKTVRNVYHHSLPYNYSSNAGLGLNSIVVFTIENTPYTIELFN